MKTYIGIDNGISGGVAVIGEDIFYACETPIIEIGKVRRIDVVGLHKWLNSDTLHCLSQHNILFILEQGQKQPAFGCKGNFSNGYSFGLIHGMLEIIGLPYVLIDPKTWQKVMLQGIRGKDQDTKSAALECVKRLFPRHESLWKTEKGRIKTGVVDALLMAEYGRRQNL